MRLEIVMIQILQFYNFVTSYRYILLSLFFMV